ncbi:MAG: hypothetical protein IPG22_17260 [Acidobacteria bacterium]|nr:hypothetical protein [Acidobacteriota bacterium]
MTTSTPVAERIGILFFGFPVVIPVSEGGMKFCFSHFRLTRWLQRFQMAPKAQHRDDLFLAFRLAFVRARWSLGPDSSEWTILRNMPFSSTNSVFTSVFGSADIAATFADVFFTVRGIAC